MSVKKTKALAVKKPEDKKLVWAGAQALMGKAEAGKEKERNLVVLTAQVLNISPFGVNILGSVPYINKLGLNEKLAEYTPDAKVAYNWIEYAKDDTAKAICAARIELDGKPVTDWVIGECSPSSMKMSTLKGYQNHMAQTRAKNRAILELHGVKIHEDMMANIKRLSMEQNSDKQALAQIGQATATSAEEAVVDESKVRNEKAKEVAEVTALKKYAVDCGAEVGKEQAFIEQVLGRSVDLNNLTGRGAILVKTQLAAKRTK